MNKYEAALDIIEKLSFDYNDTPVEITCPKCCPNGDDPEWSYTSAFTGGKVVGFYCGYNDC